MPPSAWVRRFAPLIPSGEVLDLACGSGRHAKLLHAAGRHVLAADRDANALMLLAANGIDTLCIDLENGDETALAELFRPARFAGIVVTNYLHRPLFPLLTSALASGGVLIYETFSQGNERFGRPSNPNFLLTPGELLAVTQSASRPLEVVAYERGVVAVGAVGSSDAPRIAVVQRVCAIASSDPATLPPCG